MFEVPVKVWYWVGSRGGGIIIGAGYKSGGSGGWSHGSVGMV